MNGQDCSLPVFHQKNVNNSHSETQVGLSGIALGNVYPEIKHKQHDRDIYQQHPRVQQREAMGHKPDFERQV
jgi:hypothetical protein